MEYYSSHPMEWEVVIAIIKGYITIDEYIKEQS